MNIIAFNGSPRPKGNSEIIMNEVVELLTTEGLSVKTYNPSKMNISPCQNCGGCDKTGECIIKDEMGDIYDAIKHADRIIIITPVFFFSLPAQLKAMIDRCQSFWCAKYWLKKPIPEGELGRKGLLVTVGGMDKEIGFKCSNSCATAFFRTINVPHHDQLFFKHVDAAGAIKQHPTAFEDIKTSVKKLIQK